jgi:hypothetical protein
MKELVGGIDGSAESREALRSDAEFVVAVDRRGSGQVKVLRTGGVSSYLVSNGPVSVAVIPSTRPRR